MISILFGLGMALQAGKYVQTAVWHPAGDFRTKVLTACEHAGSGFGRCFAEQMKAAGASPEALQFTHAVDDNGYMQQFRAVGQVGVALVFYPFRANENDGLLLVNGQPPVINVDEIQKLPSDEMKADPKYQAVVQQHANASVWPDDRANTNNLLALSFPDGSQQFVADYRIQEGCHACAVLGKAFFGFTFDASGKFAGARFTGFTSSYHPNSPLTQTMITVKPDSTFTLLLPVAGGTGYSWTLAPSNATVVQRARQPNRASGDNRPGAQEEEQWSFRTRAEGDDTLQFRYTRPWEKNTAPAKQLEISVHVRR